MKKVTFEAARPSQSAQNKIDDWVHDRKRVQIEPTKRLTVDIPLSLHKRIKIECAIHNLNMADVIRDLLLERFPATPQPESGEPS